MPYLQATTLVLPVVDQIPQEQIRLIHIYALQVKAQSDIKLAAILQTDLGQELASMNDRLWVAQQVATEYLQIIQPNLIEKLTIIGNYFSLNHRVPLSPSSGVSIAQWHEDLAIFQHRAGSYQIAAEQVVDELQILREKMISDFCGFVQTIHDLHPVMNKVMGSRSHNRNEQAREQLAAIQKDYEDLLVHSKAAIEAISTIEELWHYLSLDLGNLVSHLGDGIYAVEKFNRTSRSQLICTDALAAAHLDLQDVLQDIRGIRTQMMRIDARI